MNTSLLDLQPESYGLTPSLGADIVRIDGLMAQMLSQLEGFEFVDYVRRIVASDLADLRMEARDRPEQLAMAARALTLTLQLINGLEQKEIVRVNRQRRKSAGRKQSETIRRALRGLKDAGYDAPAARQLISRVLIEPTFTAHPTEAKRRAILDKLHAIVLELEPRSGSQLQQPLDDIDPDARLVELMSQLWLTEEMRTGALAVSEEVENAIYFLDRTVFDVVAWIQSDLTEAFRETWPGEDAADLAPVFRYRSWVGGDRDGNPNVTPDVTWNAIRAYSQAARSRYQSECLRLSAEYSFSSDVIAPSQEFVKDVNESAKRSGISEEVAARYAREPYALHLLTMSTRLSQENYTESEFAADLARLRQELEPFPHVPIHDLRQLQLQFESFGFRLVTLDIRQHSMEHGHAIHQKLTAAGAIDGTYDDLTEDEKIEVLRREIANPRPLVGTDWKGDAKTENVRETFRIIKRARESFGADCIRTMIVSMTHGLSDWLEPVLLAKEAGLIPLGSDALEYVPLFENVDDLNAAAGHLDAWLSLPEIQSHVAAHGGIQEIMLGYSDSSKDGGYLAANWGLYSSQDAMARVGRAHGVAIRFFHGRGGTVGRGGGRANQAISSQPDGSFCGQIRFTEQGEVISFRYSLQALAERHLEQIMGAVITKLAEKPNPVPTEFLALSESLANESRRAYRKFVYENPHFWTFYIHATPIRHISLLHIASRPVGRSSDQLTGLDDLRAIPWNFAWVQSRYVLVGWYGMGDALSKRSTAEKAQMKQMYAEWPFFRTVIDNAQLELMRAHMPTARAYGARAVRFGADPGQHPLIEAEFDRSRSEILAASEMDELLEHARTVANTVRFRNPIVEPLHQMQIAIMDVFDEAERSETNIGLSRAMMQTIAGIAAGMQSTG